MLAVSRDLRWIWITLAALGASTLFWAPNPVVQVTEHGAIYNVQRFLDGLPDWLWVIGLVAYVPLLLAIGMTFVTAAAMLLGLRRRYVPGVAAMILAVCSGLAVVFMPLTWWGLAELPEHHATIGVPLYFLSALLMTIGGVCLRRIAVAEQRRSAAELAAVDAELARRDGPLPGHDGPQRDDAS